MIAREPHRAQQKVRDEPLLRLALDLPEDGLEVLGRDLLELGGQAIAERRDELRELLDALGIGLLVDAIQGGRARAGELLRHRLVGGQHEFLDGAHAVEACVGDDPRHLAELVEHELGLGQVEGERPPLVRRCRMSLASSSIRSKREAERRELAAQLRVAVDDALDLLVGHARPALDHAVVELRFADPRPGVQLQDDGLGQAVLVLHQAADPAGERVGQHRDHAVGEVHRRPPEVRLLVEGRSRPDVVRASAMWTPASSRRGRR